MRSSWISLVLVSYSYTISRESLTSNSWQYPLQPALALGPGRLHWSPKTIRLTFSIWSSNEDIRRCKIPRWRRNSSVDRSSSFFYDSRRSNPHILLILLEKCPFDGEKPQIRPIQLLTELEALLQITDYQSFLRYSQSITTWSLVGIQARYL